MNIKIIIMSKEIKMKKILMIFPKKKYQNQIIKKNKKIYLKKNRKKSLIDKLFLTKAMKFLLKRKKKMKLQMN